MRCVNPIGVAQATRRPRGFGPGAASQPSVTARASQPMTVKAVCIPFIAWGSPVPAVGNQQIAA